MNNRSENKPEQEDTAETTQKMNASKYLAVTQNQINTLRRIMGFTQVISKESPLTAKEKLCMGLVYENQQKMKKRKLCSNKQLGKII